MPYDYYGNWYDDVFTEGMSPDMAGQYGGQVGNVGTGAGTGATVPPQPLPPDHIPWTPGSSVYQPEPTTTVAGKPDAIVADKSADTGSGGGGGTGGRSYMDYYGWGGPMAPDLSWLRDAPAFEFANFQVPGAEGMFADPGYQFRVDQGRRALEQSAAGKGTLRTGGTLKDILSFGQNMASQEYGNAFNRALNTYDTNLNTARERFAPKFASWQNDQSARQNASNRAFERAWDTYSWSVPSANTIFNAGLT